MDGFCCGLSGSFMRVGGLTFLGSLLFRVGLVSGTFFFGVWGVSLVRRGRVLGFIL